MPRSANKEHLHLYPQRIDRYAEFPSVYLDRKVILEVFLPPNYDQLDEPCDLLLFNDGQQSLRMRFDDTLTRLHRNGEIRPLIVAAIHAGHDRVNEYGAAAMSDYAHRGNKAAGYTYFIIHELLPFLEGQYNVYKSAAHRGFAGFSLGGLSAFDIVWHYPHLFQTAGIFSGSFWWRKKALDGGYSDDDRIMHRLVKAGGFHPDMKLWFSAGTEEEKEDRNQNGIIDVIDDILDLMNELRGLGFEDHQMVYHQSDGGQHNEETWSHVFPLFLKWAYGVKVNS
jgi:enterochelin esterase-like enzyme